MTREYRLIDDSDSEGNQAITSYQKLVLLERLGSYDGSRLEGHWHDFEHSPEFAGLSTCEQALARYTIKRIVGDQAPWTAQSGTDTDNLLSMPSPKRSIPSTAHDAAVLSGMAGWEIAVDLEEWNGAVSREMGSRVLTLSDYVNIAVAASIFGRKANGGDLSYLVSNDDTIVRQSVGGTPHGDFLAEWTRFVASGPVLDPTGQARTFAPTLESGIVHAYHSIETKLAMTMLRFMAAGDLGALRSSKARILNMIGKADVGRGGGDFADFGSRSGNYQSAISADTFRIFEPGEVLAEFVVAPSDFAMRMEVVSTGDGVVLRNVRSAVAGGEQGDEIEEYDSIRREMTIGRDEIPKFIATMAAASAGRTSLEQVRMAIEKAYVIGSDDAPPRR